jgi:hypothetical protein
MKKLSFLICFLLFFASVQAQIVGRSGTLVSKINHPYIIDLRDAEIYEYELETDHHKITVIGTDINWEAVMHEAAANFDLKVILLPKKEALFSLAVAIEVLHHQLESSFFNRPLTYTKFFKKYLTEEEQEYLEEQRKRVSEMKGLAKLSLWRMMFDQAKYPEQQLLIADSLISLGYKTTGHDAEDLEAVISAYLGYSLAQVRDYRSAIERFERCYEIRKKRKDPLSVNYNRLWACYNSLKMQEAIEKLDAEVLEIGRHSAGFSDDIVTNVFRNLTERNANAGVQYFEQNYLSQIKNMHGLDSYFWEFPNYLPYPIAIKNAQTEEKKIYWIDRWLKIMLEYSDPKHYRTNLYPILEFMKQFPSEKMEQKRLELFETYALTEERGIWQAGPSYLSSGLSEDERLWFNQVPYGRLLAYTTLVEDKKELLTTWMEKALKTKNDTIIEATALSLSNKLMRLGFEELAGQYFEDYYCKRRLNKPIDANVWYNGNLYSGEEEHLEKLIALAKTYADFKMVANLYNHSIIWVRDPDNTIRYERYLKAYEVYKEYKFEGGMRWQLRLILSSCKNLPLPQRLEHAIELYELGFRQQYSLGLSSLNTVISDVLNAEGWDKKELKQGIKVLKNWQKRLKKEGEAMQEALDWAKNNELLLKKEL